MLVFYTGSKETKENAIENFSFKNILENTFI